MAQFNTRKLDYLDDFPSLDLKLVNDKNLRLPADTKGDWTILLVYRGHW